MTVTMAGVQRLATEWILAQPGDYDPSSGRGPEWGKAAPAGLLIWLFLGAALFLLIKSMNRHIKRVPKAFQDSAEEQTSAAGPQQSQDGQPSPGQAGDKDSAGMAVTSAEAEPTGG